MKSSTGNLSGCRLNYIFRFSRGHAIAYGYYTLGTALRSALLDNGFVFNAGSNINFFVGSPNVFWPVFIPKKSNMLLTMWEADRLPRKYVRRLRHAKLIIVPCAYNKKTFEAGGLKNHIEVCNLGYDDSLIKYKHRERGNGNFKFLWVGAPNIRKGYDIVGKAFGYAFKSWEPAELRIKTTGLWEDDEKTEVFKALVREDVPPGEWQVWPKVTLDNRNLSREGLICLYEDAHCFVFPSRGEGFGLPALEAMASGCLVIAPAIQGLAEFVKPDTAWIVPCGKIRAYYPDPVLAPNPDWKELARLMRRAYEHYQETVKLREYAAHWVADRFTWKHCAERLKEIISSEVREEAIGHETALQSV